MTKNPAFVKWLILISLSLTWGSSFILIKKGLVGFGFVEAASIRLMAAGAAFLPLGMWHFNKIPREKWPYLFLITLIGMFIPAFLFCLAQQHVQSSVAGILNALTSVFTFVFSIFLFKKTYKISHVLGLLLGLASAVMLILERSDAAFTLNIYAGLIVLATIFYGLNINLIKHHLHDVPAISLSAVSVSIGGLMAFLFVFLPRHEHYAMTEDKWWPLVALITLGILNTGLATVLYYKLIKITSALFASSTTFVMPIVAVMWGLLDGELFTWVHALSIVGILTAVVLIRKV